MITFGYMGRTGHSLALAIVRISDAGERVVNVVICPDGYAMAAWKEMHPALSWSWVTPDVFKAAFLDGVPV